MDYTIIKGCQSNDKLRHSFNELATETFGLNFENWYQNGYWNEKYNPYSIVCDGVVVSNISVNIIDCELDSQVKQYIQFGTVMTKKSFRGNGFSRVLMETVLHDYASCDGFFLFANDSVLDFYPKFGFEKVNEYRYRVNVDNGGVNSAELIPMKTNEEWLDFLKEKNKRFSNGVLRLYTDDLLMFYLSQFMQENVFYIRQLDSYVIAETENDTLILHDVFSKTPVDMLAVCNSFGKSIKKVEFAFVPLKTENLIKYEYKKDDSNFFVLGNSIIQDMKTINSFPEIAHG